MNGHTKAGNDMDYELTRPLDVAHYILLPRQKLRYGTGAKG